jgi:hypothetical protein
MSISLLFDEHFPSGTQMHCILWLHRLPHQLKNLMHFNKVYLVAAGWTYFR